MAGRLADFAGRPDDEHTLAAGRAAAGTFSWIPGLGCASVAAVRGHAYGAGLQLALACDFRIFAEGTKVGLTETRYGLLPDMGATVRLPRIVGEARARELILLGDVIDAEQALRIGLANQVVPGQTSTPPRPGSPGAWPPSRRSRCGAPGGRSTRRGTTAPRRASGWPCTSRSAACSPRTSPKPARRWRKAGPHAGGAARHGRPRRRETPGPPAMTLRLALTSLLRGLFAPLACRSGSALSSSRTAAGGSRVALVSGGRDE